MEKNKTGKYLKYAIGEIVLVVIGILIALSINNWNDERKNRIKEEIVLKGLLVDLKTNQKLIKEGLIDYKENKKLSQGMAKLIGQAPTQANIVLMDSLTFWSAEYTTVELISTSIIALSTSDKIDLLKNENLKQQILKYPTYIELYKEREDLVRSIVVDQIRPNLEVHISMQKWWDGLPQTFQTDYEGFFDDMKLSNNYINRLYQINGSIRRLENLKNENDNLLTTVKSDLDNRFE